MQLGSLGKLQLPVDQKQHAAQRRMRHRTQMQRAAAAQVMTSLQSTDSLLAKLSSISYPFDVTNNLSRLSEAVLTLDPT
jgi:hypothetical protein